ncbi:MAG: cupin domain-containing protein [Alkalibacterium sp.]|nr:cupin domain-containing protein [Alkalibacterium sp.]
MAEVFWFKENPPFPNHPLPVIYYPQALKKMLENSSNGGEDVKAFFKENGYSNGWINGIHDYHHYHSNTHEVLGCVSGTAVVQLGGPHSDEVTVTKGDVILLPAGVAHKRLGASKDFSVVGAYPNDLSPDMQLGDAVDYERVQKRSYDVPVPDTDPVSKKSGAVKEYWAME